MSEKAHWMARLTRTLDGRPECPHRTLWAELFQDGRIVEIVISKSVARDLGRRLTEWGES